MLFRSEPVIGANVIKKGTPANGTVTDIDGNFSLNVNNNAVLRISFIGYTDQEINTAGKTQFDITLLENAEALNERNVVFFL